MKAAHHRVTACTDKREGSRDQRCSGWWLPLLWCGAILLLLGLGGWQVERGYQKQHWLEQSTQSAWQDPESLTLSAALELQRWQPVELTLRWLEVAPIMLDNRTRRGRAGYEVLAPAQLGDGTAVVVNLGWHPAPRLRSEIPDLTLPRGDSRVRAVAGVPPATYTLDGSIGAEVWRIQRIDTQILGHRWQTPLLPWVLWLEQPVVPGLDAGHLMALQMPPQRHWGYAVQWFGLALVVAVMGLVWGRRARWQ